VKNGPAFFQNMMQDVLKDIHGTHIFVYIDDIVVASEDFDSHMEHIALLLEALKKAKLKVNVNKCQFCLQQLKLLGKVVNGKGVMTDPGLLQAMEDFPEPNSVTKVRQFLGLVGHYRMFIQDFHQKAFELNKLTRKDVKWTWGPLQQKAFKKLKEAMLSAPVLAHPDFAKPFVVQTDASKIGAGAILAQKGDDEKIHPVAYASWLFNSAQVNYSATERELLAIVMAVRKWRPFIIGSKFLVETDHKALEGYKTLNDPFGKITRWSVELAQYDMKVKYIAGKNNEHADALSRNFDIEEIAAMRCYGMSDESMMEMLQLRPTKVMALDANRKIEEFCCANEVQILPQDHKEWRDEQNKDPDYYPIIRFIENGDLPKDDTRAKSILSKMHLYSIDDETKILMKEPVFQGEQKRRCVPSSWRRLFVSFYHDSVWAGAHLGRDKTAERIKRQFYFKNLDNYVAIYVKTCPICQKVKNPAEKSEAPLGVIHTNHRWDLVSIDLWKAGAKSKDGNEYVLTVIDGFTKFAWALPIPNKEAKTVASALYHRVLVPEGMPARLISDQGTEFVNSTLNDVSKLFGIEKTTTTAYHPQGNAYSERIHRFFKNALSSFVRDDPRIWDELLPALLLTYNDSYHEAIGTTPALAFRGRHLNAPGEIVDPPKGEFTQLQWAEKLKYIFARTQALILQRNEEKRLRNEIRSESVGFSKFSEGDLVSLFIPQIRGTSKKLTPGWINGWTVKKISRDGRVFYLTDQFGEDLPNPISISRIKKYNPRAGEHGSSSTHDYVNYQEDEADDLELLEDDEVEPHVLDPRDEPFVPSKEVEKEILKNQNATKGRVLREQKQKKLEDKNKITKQPTFNTPMPSKTNTTDKWINRKIQVWWQDGDGDRWESGTILSQLSKCFFVIKYDFLVKYKKEAEDPTTVDPDVIENLVGKKRENWKFL